LVALDVTSEDAALDVERRFHARGGLSVALDGVVQHMFEGDRSFWSRRFACEFGVIVGCGIGGAPPGSSTTSCFRAPIDTAGALDHRRAANVAADAGVARTAAAGSPLILARFPRSRHPRRGTLHPRGQPAEARRRVGRHGRQPARHQMPLPEVRHAPLRIAVRPVHDAAQSRARALRKKGHVACVTISRPDVLNALHTYAYAGFACWRDVGLDRTFTSASSPARARRSARGAT
jgi:hypothetical protein